MADHSAPTKRHAPQWSYFFVTQISPVAIESPRQNSPRLIAVTPGRRNTSVELLAKQMIALEPFVDAIQIREKSRTPKEIERLLLELEEANFPFDKLIMNDRADIAVSFQIPYLQVTENSLDIIRLKSAFPGLKFGRSLHSFKQIESLGKHFAYCLLGHIFHTKSKRYPPFGVGNLPRAKALAAEANTKLILIGGITHKNVREVLPFADGVAQMSSLFDDPETIKNAGENLGGILEAQRMRVVMSAFSAENESLT